MLTLTKENFAVTVRCERDLGYPKTRRTQQTCETHNQCNSLVQTDDFTLHWNTSYWWFEPLLTVSPIPIHLYHYPFSYWADTINLLTSDIILWIYHLTDLLENIYIRYSLIHSEKIWRRQQVY